MSSFNSVPHPVSRDKLSSSKASASPSELVQQLQTMGTNNIEILKRIRAIGGAGVANGVTSEMFKLSDNDYKVLVHNLNRIDFAIKKGLDTTKLRKIASGENGGLHEKAYAVLLFISDSDMKIPDLLEELGITGGGITELLDTKFNGDHNKMHEWIMGKAYGLLIR
ncbi:MAG TPA: hypothetical protein VND15_03675 [Candidatus Acidoferrales bacterium]|nr:hypothetical protein [Candidatus Acidoferrales bacterium]